METFLRRNENRPDSGYGRPEIRFWKRVDKNGPIHPVHGQCWQWTGSIFKGRGYGQLTVKCRNYSSHRLSWIIHFGSIPEGKWVLHKCDNRLCVNPSHLFLGCGRDNIHDAMEKGRDGWVGERNGNATVTEKQVREIRELRRKHRRGRGWDREFGVAALARRFNTTVNVISAIVHNRSWRHIL